MKPARVPAVVSIAMVTVVFLGAWQWPMNPEAIETGFGLATSASTMLRGVEFAGEGEDVVAASDGTIVFRDSRLQDAHAPGRSGGIVILDHDNGWRTIYSGLKPEGLAAGERVLEGRSIGTAGANGARFEIYDRRTGFYVNPLTLLPVRDIESEAQISGIRLVSVDDEDSESRVPSFNRVSHRSGETEIRVQIGGDAGATAVALTRGGSTFGELLLERIEPGDPDQMVWDGGGRSADGLFDGNGWLRLTTVTVPENGSVSFTARVRNARGEETTRVFTIDGVPRDE